MFKKCDAKELLKNPEMLKLEAGKIRKKVYGDEIFLRGIIEFSNYCRKNCLYCGIRKSSPIERYRLFKDEIVYKAKIIEKSGIKTVVLQSGEDLLYTRDYLCEIIKEIKKETHLTITLCIGERAPDDYKAFFDAGAKRFLIKHETSNEKVYERLHPGEKLSDRLKIYDQLKKIGYEVGLGNIIGLPFTDLEDYINDIFLMKELDCDMAGMGPFIPSGGTPLSGYSAPHIDLVINMVALARVVLQDVNIPATTALYTLGDLSALINALNSGCNVIMPNFTPELKRKKYSIYDGKRPVSIDFVKKILPEQGFRISDSYGYRRRLYV